MKKLLTLVLAIAMLGTLLVGCGEKTTPDQPETPDDSTATVEPMKLDIASIYTDGSCVDSACIKLTQLLNDSGLYEATYSIMVSSELLVTVSKVSSVAIS